MTPSVQLEVERWQHELDRLADADDWQIHELRLAETQHTISSYRVHILPLLIGEHPYEIAVREEIEALVDRLEVLRTKLYSGTATPEEIAENLAALRALAHVVERSEAADTI